MNPQEELQDIWRLCKNCRVEIWANHAAADLSSLASMMVRSLTHLSLGTSSKSMVMWSGPP